MFNFSRFSSNPLLIRSYKNLNFIHKATEGIFIPATIFKLLLSQGVVNTENTERKASEQVSTYIQKFIHSFIEVCAYLDNKQNNDHFVTWDNAKQC